MAVYTHLSDQHIQDFLITHYACNLLSATPIAEGTENTNYHIRAQCKDTLENCEFVLTLFETTPLEEVEKFVALIQYLVSIDIAVPTAIASKQNLTIHSIANMPSILTKFASGKHPQCADQQECYQVAAELAKIHLCEFDGELSRYDLLSSLQDMYKQTEPIFIEEERQLIESELTDYAQFKSLLETLPHGVMHTDLFKDNTLFQDNHLTAILDFYSAASGPLIVDLAVLINDWCFTDDKDIIDENISAVLEGYQSYRPLSDEENNALAIVLRMTACRFWLSRGVLTQQHGHKLHGKDPDAFKSLLLSHLDSL